MISQQDRSRGASRNLGPHANEPKAFDQGENARGGAARAVEVSGAESLQMKIVLAIIGSLLLFAVVAFCVFGFLATFEPTNNPGQFMAFRIGYAIIGLGCVTGVILLIVNAARQ